MIGLNSIDPIHALPLVAGDRDFFVSKESELQVHEIMSTRIVSVELDDRLSTVREIFDSVRFHHLLVVEEGKLFGVISDRDLLRALSPYLGTEVETYRDIATLQKQVHHIVSRAPITLTAQASINDAVQLFLAHNISCVPIVNAAFEPIGIVSWRDILRTLVT